MNIYENGSTHPTPNNQNGFLFLDQQFDPSIPSNSLTGDSELIDVQNYSMNIDNQSHQILQKVPEIGRWSLINDPTNGQYTILTDNLISANPQAQVRLDNLNITAPQLSFNQHFTKFAIPQPELIQSDVPGYNFASNLILTFPQNDDSSNMINNVITVPQTPGNHMEYINSMNPNHQWMNHIAHIQPMDPRTSYIVRPMDRADRNSRMAQYETCDQKFTKPVFSYSCLIALALKNSPTGSLPVNEIYRYMQYVHWSNLRENFPYFKSAPDGWKNSVRHNLSLNKAFQKNVRSDSSTTQRKGCLWTLKPDKRRLIDKEIKKWFKKHPEAIRKSMTNPENFHQYFNAELEDSAEDNSRSPTREEAGTNERQSNFDSSTIQQTETQSLNLEHIPFFQNGIINNNTETIRSNGDQFETNLNSVFGEFMTSNWNTFSMPNNTPHDLNDDSNAKNHQFDIFHYGPNSEF
ncbi:Forkhead box protein N4 [Thelohanellus kitauei]|uniref:Forkhead box protein N4 n=1 Tax=Thelohanellus kitauei TaxID=669202 RepID=A0A0C2NAJ3_THEKT|nr:Forkhead box protein N4 [Thelohanellus kitauei]